MVSIIIPCYNKSKYITETLNSIISQSSNNWECIIIDDASNDNSLDIINNIIDDKEKFRLVVNSISKGASACRNQGAKIAIGEYFIFLDADDLLSLKCIENRLDLMNSKKELDFSVFKMGTFYKEIGDSVYVWDNFTQPHLNRFLSHDLPWAICSVIWRRNKFFEIGCFNEKFKRLQDIELHTKSIIANSKYLIFDKHKIDCFYRIDNKRLKGSFYQLMEDKLESCFLYVDYFNKMLYENGLRSKTRFLKGTLFKILSEIYSAYYLKLIDYDSHKYLINQFIENYIKCDLFSKIDLFIIKLYMRISNITRLKGLNYLFNKFLIK
jgi:glycosyltransferase involved in cell wall biosynthesis